MFNAFFDHTNALRLLVMAAALFMLLPLPVMQYVGEEGLMAIKSYEMFVRDDWLHPSILGHIWPHSPLWHWPVIVLCKLIGWQYVDIAIRLVSVASTWGSAFICGLAASWLFRSHQQASWLAALVYLTMGEVSFWYGWLGYVDAMFGMFIFAAIMALWKHFDSQKMLWLFVSLGSITLAFLTKNITAYALYAAAGLVLLWRLQRWEALIEWKNLLALLLTLSIPVLWQQFVIQGGANTASTTINDALRNFAGFGLMDYLQHWISYPIVFVFRAFPMTLFLLWLWWLKKQEFALSPELRTLVLILLVCLLPFWVSANATPRYLVPLYGFGALILTGLLLQLNSMRLKHGLKIIVIVLLLKLPYSLLILPYIKDWLPERNVIAVAKEIMHIVGNKPLYTRNDVATGLAIAAYIDVWREHEPPVTWYKGRPLKAYVLAETESPRLGKLVNVWPLRGDRVYLYWHEEFNGY